MKVYYQGQFIGNLKGKEPDLYGGGYYQVPVPVPQVLFGTQSLTYHSAYGTLMFKVDYTYTVSKTNSGELEVTEIQPYLEWTGGDPENLEKVIFG